MLKTLSLALEVLKMFTREKPEWGGRELATTLQENHTKIHRILVTLEKYDLLKKDAQTKKYSLGYAVLELGMIKYEGLNVTELIHPILETLSNQTGESTFLSVIDKDKAITLDAVETKNTVRFSVSIGSTAPLYVGASYRTILAFMPEEFIKAIIDPSKLIKYTDKTIIDPDRLKMELQKIREQGWAVSEGEYTDDVTAFAVPIYKGDKVIGSLAVSGPIYRMTDDKTETYLSHLLEAKKKMEEVILKYNLKLN